jgi:hypothetical protein
MEENQISGEESVEAHGPQPMQMQGGVINAEQVHAAGAIKQINANQVTVEQSGVLSIQGGSIEVSNAGVGFARAQTAIFNDSGANILVAESVEGNEPAANLMIARSVRGDSIKTSILLSGNVEGPVETKLDTQGALVFGLAVGAGFGLLLSLFQLLLGRKR